MSHRLLAGPCSKAFSVPVLDVLVLFGLTMQWTLCCCPQSQRCVQVFVTPWTVAHQASLSMRFPRQECWNGLPCPPPVDLRNPRIKPRSPALQVDSLPSEPLGISATVCHLQLPMQKLIQAIYTPEALGEKLVSFIRSCQSPSTLWSVLESFTFLPDSSCPTLSVSSLLIMKGFRGGRRVLIILFRTSNSSRDDRFAFCQSSAAEGL